jgi:hypothetical protein
VKYIKKFNEDFDGEFVFGDTEYEYILKSLNSLYEFTKYLETIDNLDMNNHYQGLSTLKDILTDSFASFRIPFRSLSMGNTELVRCLLDWFDWIGDMVSGKWVMNKTREDQLKRYMMNKDNHDRKQLMSNFKALYEMGQSERHTGVDDLVDIIEHGVIEDSEVQMVVLRKTIGYIGQELYSDEDGDCYVTESGDNYMSPCYFYKFKIKYNGDLPKSSIIGQSDPEHKKLDHIEKLLSNYYEELAAVGLEYRGYHNYLSPATVIEPGVSMITSLIIEHSWNH